jgi:hypothetical protein
LSTLGLLGLPAGWAAAGDGCKNADDNQHHGDRFEGGGCTHVQDEDGTEKGAQQRDFSVTLSSLHGG